ncbi:DUF5337 family protein [Algicella marina]|uniref:DUF5337 domain-containing protein n=1 Tax=Algicella marina TaxID=2683284 RepID=A0A6P1T006_9RHOB|nr:DUF5337 family protein [Algicella marina]QHQ34609.1 hypothetical protein GO499_05095 [Algicella marina]
MSGKTERTGKDARLPAAVIAVAACVWLAGMALGPRLGLSPRYAFLLDLSCMAAFVWALVAVLRIRQAGRSGE